jgi:hypothetical protein
MHSVLDAQEQAPHGTVEHAQELCVCVVCCAQMDGHGCEYFYMSRHTHSALTTLNTLFTSLHYFKHSYFKHSYTPLHYTLLHPYLLFEAHQRIEPLELILGDPEVCACV